MQIMRPSWVIHCCRSVLGHVYLNPGMFKKLKSGNSIVLIRLSSLLGESGETKVNLEVQTTVCLKMLVTYHLVTYHFMNIETVMQTDTSQHTKQDHIFWATGFPARITRIKFTKILSAVPLKYFIFQCEIIEFGG